MLLSSAVGRIWMKEDGKNLLDSINDLSAEPAMKQGVRILCAFFGINMG